MFLHWLVCWFVGLVMPVQEIFLMPWLLLSAQYKIFFPHKWTISILLSLRPSKLAAGSPVSQYVSLGNTVNGSHYLFCHLPSFFTLVGSSLLMTITGWFVRLFKNRDLEDQGFYRDNTEHKISYMQAFWAFFYNITNCRHNSPKRWQYRNFMRYCIFGCVGSIPACLLHEPPGFESRYISKIRKKLIFKKEFHVRVL